MRNGEGPSGDVVVDSSAIVANVLGEPGAEEIDHLVAAYSQPLLSAATLVETGMVLASRLGGEGLDVVGRFLSRTGTSVLPFTEEHAIEAVRGWRRYGKGNHPAALNLGDCFTYGLAKVERLPILCTGDDFARTDAEVVRPSPAAPS